MIYSPGTGGLSFGFAHDVDFEIIAANEINKVFAATYTANHPKTKMYCCDIKKLLKKFNRKVDVILGGPPCQAYTTLGKRNLNDPRAKLFKYYYFALKQYKPTVFIYENVRGLYSMDNGKLLPEIISLFKSLKYNVSLKLINCADYGVLQLRKRIFIVGSKVGEFEFPTTTHYGPTESPFLNYDKYPWITLENAISDLPKLKEGTCCNHYTNNAKTRFQNLMRYKNKKLTLHFAKRQSKNLLRYMKYLPGGGTFFDVPEKVMIKPMIRRKYSEFKNFKVFGRLAYNICSFTVTSAISSCYRGNFIHPTQHRLITLREAARIQTFPDWYKFTGSYDNIAVQLGNAVPPFVSIHLKNAVKQHLN